MIIWTWKLAQQCGMNTDDDFCLGIPLPVFMNLSYDQKKSSFSQLVDVWKVHWPSQDGQEKLLTQLRCAWCICSLVGWVGKCIAFLARTLAINNLVYRKDVVPGNAKVKFHSSEKHLRNFLANISLKRKLPNVVYESLISISVNILWAVNVKSNCGGKFLEK